MAQPKCVGGGKKKREKPEDKPTATKTKNAKKTARKA